jgi:hypothetical protein
MAGLYTLKVKNTFLEVNDSVDDSDDGFDEEEGGGMRRQLTEPAPSTTPLFATYKSVASLKVSENTQTMNRLISASTTLSDDDLKVSELSMGLEGSTSSSDVEISEHSQPECEPEFENFRDGIARQVTEEFWGDQSLQSDVEYACMIPLLSQAVLEPYQYEPLVHSFAFAGNAATLGNGEVDEKVPANVHSVSKKKRDSNMANNGKRPQRESLIDQAARKQKLRQTKQASKHQGRQAASPAHSNMETQRDASRSLVAKFCHRCGCACQGNFNFCRFCGAELVLRAR